MYSRVRDLLQDQLHVMGFAFMYHPCALCASLSPSATLSSLYNKCPEILNTKVANKLLYANSADPDQTASSRAV